MARMAGQTKKNYVSCGAAKKGPTGDFFFLFAKIMFFTSQKMDNIFLPNKLN